MPTDRERANGRCGLHRCAVGVAIVSGVFCVAMCALTVANHVQVRLSDPLNSPALARLRQQFNSEPRNKEIQEEIRALDVLARQAYFTSQSQIRRGVVLLLLGAGVFVLSLQAAVETRETHPDPQGCPGSDDAWRQRRLGRRLVGVLGAGTLSAAVALGFLARSELSAELAEPAPAPAISPSRMPTVPPAPQPIPPEPAFPSAKDIRRNWPCFRGPYGNGIAFVESAPIEWDGTEREGILWRVAVPARGFSSPVVWEDRIFVTGGDSDKRELFCYRAADGALLWRRSAEEILDQPDSVEVDESTGYAAPTAATDGRRVAAIFATGHMLCTDMEGDVLWSEDFGAPENHYAHSSSLLMHEGKLFVQIDDSDNPRLIAFDVATGKRAWEATRYEISWSSPVLMDGANGSRLLLTDSVGITAYDAAIGTELWREDCRGEMGPSAAYSGGMVFACNDGAIAAGIRLNDGAPSIVWEWYEDLPDTASPVATADHVYLATSYGVLSCVGAKDGKTVWSQEFESGFYASPILAGELVYALDLDGVMHVFRATNAYESVAACAMGEGSAATPAFANDRMYVRGHDHLFCIGAPE